MYFMKKLCTLWRRDDGRLRKAAHVCTLAHHHHFHPGFHTFFRSGNRGDQWINLHGCCKLRLHTYQRCRRRGGRRPRADTPGSHRRVLASPPSTHSIRSHSRRVRCSLLAGSAAGEHTGRWRRPGHSATCCLRRWVQRRRPDGRVTVLTFS